MEFYKFVAIIAMLVACAFAVQSAAIEPEVPAQPVESVPPAPGPQQGLHPREKKWATPFVSAYSALPLTSYPYAAYPAYYPAYRTYPFYSAYYL